MKLWYEIRQLEQVDPTYYPLAPNIDDQTLLQLLHNHTFALSHSRICTISRIIALASSHSHTYTYTWGQRSYKYKIRYWRYSYRCQDLVESKPTQTKSILNRFDLVRFKCFEHFNKSQNWTVFTATNKHKGFYFILF